MSENTFRPRFMEQTSVYRGIVNAWIGDGDQTGEAGCLYAEYANGNQENLGPVSSYAEAVQRGVAGPGTEFSTPELWTQHIADTSNLVAEAELWATGDSGGTPSSTNNASYYATQAADSAQSAAESASSASEAVEYAEDYRDAAQGFAGDAEGYASQAASALEGLQEYVDNASASASDAARYALDSQAWATGYRGDNPVVQYEDDQYDNHSKHWADVSKGYAEAASASELTVQGYVDDASGYASQAQGYVGDAHDEYLAAKDEADNAALSAQNAQNAVGDAEAQAVLAGQKADLAEDKVTEAANQVTLAAEQVALAQAEVTNAHNEYLAAQTQAQNAEAWAVGQRGGIPVESSDPRSTDNAALYAAQAANSLASIKVTTASTTYQYGASGQTAPSGTWYSYEQMPAPIEGQYLWSKTVLTFGDNTTTTYYSVSYIGVNGEGSVQSVNGSGGVVVLTGESINVNSENGAVTINNKFSTVDTNIARATEVYEYASESAFPETGVAGKLYVDRTANKIFRWDETGTEYVAVGGGGGGGSGTVTKVKMNNQTPIEPDNQGVVDLGTVITAHQDISGKADKVASAVNGNFAGLNASGNLTDSGKKASDFATSAHTHAVSIAADSGTNQLTLAASTKYKLTAGGSTYIFTTPPDTNTTYSAATTSAAGLMSAADKTKLNGIATGATANTGTITGITMNGASKGTSGVVNLGTVLTAHQSLANYVTLTGAQAISGQKTFTANPIIKLTTADKSIYFQNGAGNSFAVIRASSGDTTNITGSRIKFIEYSPKSTPDTATTGYYETYQLPACSAGLGANSTYTILTTKTKVSLEQGGTGASDASGARSALGLGGAAVKAVDTSISAGSTSTNLPTSKAVATFVEGKGYLTSSSLSGYVKTSGNQSLSGVISFTNTTAGSDGAGAIKVTGGIYSAKAIYCASTITGSKVYNAVWNDYAECRQAYTDEPGYCVTETKNGVMAKTWERLQPGCKMISDTFGSCMGETDEAKTPIAVAGRVLAYPCRDISEYHLGDAVCSAPDGKIDIMTREEIREYPERIVGTVSEIPSYDVWYGGTKEDPKKIPVNGRIWIYVR